MPKWASFNFITPCSIFIDRYSRPTFPQLAFDGVTVGEGGGEPGGDLGHQGLRYIPESGASLFHTSETIFHDPSASRRYT